MGNNDRLLNVGKKGVARRVRSKIPCRRAQSSSSPTRDSSQLAFCNLRTTETLHAAPIYVSLSRLWVGR